MATPGRQSFLVAVIVCGRGPLALLVRAPAIVYSAPPSPSVTVDNTEANPAIVRDADNSARHVFQTSTGTFMNAFNPSGVGLTLTTVPAGKVLVIEYVSADCLGSSGVTPGTLRLGTPAPC